jgi:hypothetical protein
MYRILSASKDNYITNKIINNSFRATDANTGQAGTIDIFKLYEEATSGSDTSPTEVSRGLIKFNLKPLRDLTGSTLDFSAESFKCTMNLYDVYGGQTTPSNFKMQIFPLSRSFDEGIGRDVINFEDIDAANFITASVSGDTPSLWYMSGANKSGFLGSPDIDIISSGTLTGSSDTEGINLWVEQTFAKGDENLSVDITTVISGILSNQIPDHGFRISLSGTQETDKKTRFVKRFGSRHSTNIAVRPKIVAVWDDTIRDNHRSFYFDMTGSLFLNNSVRSTLRHIVSGTAATPITESNCF